MKTPPSPLARIAGDFTNNGRLRPFLRFAPVLFGTVAFALGALSLQAAPTRSSPIAISALNLLVSVNPDANTVSLFDAAPVTPVKLAEVAVGNDPSSVAITPNGGRAFVANAGDG